MWRAGLTSCQANEFRSAQDKRRMTLHTFDDEATSEHAALQQLRQFSNENEDARATIADERATTHRTTLQLTGRLEVTYYVGAR